MSLIDDALRRVQDPVANKELPSNKASFPEKPVITQPAPKDSGAKPHSWTVGAFEKKIAGKIPAKHDARRSIVLLSASLITGVSVLWILSLLVANPLSISKEGAKPAAKTAISDGLQASPPLNAPAAAAKSRFKLNGVVTGKGETYAVIDGRIVSKGESIEDATIVGIEESSVILQLADGTQKVIRVPR